VLELRIEFPPAKPFLPSTQAVLDAAALAFLEEFPGTTLYHRAPEECCIQLLLPSNQRPNALTSVQKEWCGLLEQEEGVTTECRGEYDPTKPPLYPALPSSSEEDNQELLPVLIEQLLRCCQLERTLVEPAQVKGGYLDAWDLSLAELARGTCWRFRLTFDRRHLVWYRFVLAEAEGIPTLEQELTQLVRQSLSVVTYQSWIGYDRDEGDGTVASAYRHAQMYPIWQQELGRLYRLVGEDFFYRLLAVC
jgi:hypothetical protein